MTDDLRTRIASAVWMRHRADVFAQVGLDALAVPERPIPPWAYGMADAVIRELTQQWRAYYGYDGYANCATREEAAQQVQSFNEALGDDWQDGEQAMVMTRYVTEWETDDE